MNRSARQETAEALRRPVSPAAGRRVSMKAPSTLGDTLALMDREIVAGSASPVVRMTAVNVTSGRSWWDWWPRLVMLRTFVRGRVRYVPDPARVEWVQTAELTLTNPDGGADCDDMVVLGNALAESIGFNSALGLAGTDDGPEHVFGLVRMPGLGPWVPVDWGGPADTGEWPAWPTLWTPDAVTR